jgi:hypothetical protein
MSEFGVNESFHFRETKMMNKTCVPLDSRLACVSLAGLTSVTNAGNLPGHRYQEHGRPAICLNPQPLPPVRLNPTAVTSVKDSASPGLEPGRRS